MLLFYMFKCVVTFFVLIPIFYFSWKSDLLICCYVKSMILFSGDCLLVIETDPAYFTECVYLISGKSQ
jgi:hypothetical protein